MLIRHLWALLTMKPPERHQRPYRQIEAAPALGMELLGEQHQIDARARQVPAGARLKRDSAESGRQVDASLSNSSSIWSTMPFTRSGDGTPSSSTHLME